MNNSKFFIDKTLDEYIKLLVENAYREIGHREIKAECGRLRSFAIVTMNQEGPVMIKCNSVARAWPEPALIGLLSHELSHVIVGDVPFVGAYGKRGLDIVGHTGRDFMNLAGRTGDRAAGFLTSPFNRLFGRKRRRHTRHKRKHHRRKHRRHTKHHRRSKHRRRRH